MWKDEAHTRERRGKKKSTNDDQVESSQILDLLSQLVDKSLVVEPQRREVSYHLLETVRQYAREKLSETG